MKIYKYEFDITAGDTQYIQLSGSKSKILYFGLQNDKIYYWALVEPDSDKESVHEVRIVGTGHDFDHKEYRYINTVFQDPFVWHFFELYIEY